MYVKSTQSLTNHARRVVSNELKPSGWNPSNSDTLCENSGSTNFTQFTYNYGAGEPYGCLQDSYSPRTYQRTYTYGGGCGNGMPTKVQGSPMPQADNSTRTPSLSVAYNPNGTVEQFNVGGQGNWQLSYTSDGMNRVQSVTDPDGVTSYKCYNPNGSVFYRETAYQNSLENAHSCPSASQIAGGATPPKYATGYGYDPDGDQVTVVSHHNCPDAPTYGPVCAANTPVPDGCNEVNVPAGTTCNFYDGLGRVVEVKQPYDTANDLYEYAWITRYLYDLTGGQQTFHGQSFSAYGNLFATQELLPSNTSVGTVTPPTPGAITNLTYKATKATAYDGIDRPITEYAATGTDSNYTTETLTWDTSPLDPGGVAGFLGKDCNSATPPPSGQCQEFDYTHDGELMTFESNDNSSPERGYVYDPDGRPTTITSASFSNPQVYTYDPDGNLWTSIDASNGDVAQNSATLTHTRYMDGYEKRLDVSSGALTQTGLFTDSYRNDGLLQTYAVNDSSLMSVPHNGTTTIAYTYTSAGRFSERSESGAAANATASPTTETYLSSPNPLGLPKKFTLPVTTLSQFSFSAENEMEEVDDANCQLGNDLFSYSLRGEGAGSVNCGGVTAQYLANGVQVSSPMIQGQNNGASFLWNDLMAVLTSVTPNGELGSSWSYDTAGRMTTQVAPITIPTPTASAVPVTVTRSYDAENHLNVTTFESPSPGPNVWPYASVNWGPDGHPSGIVTSNNGNSSNFERLHWNGDELLFTTNGTPPILDDVKVDVQGDILPGDTGYSGLTFYDRGPGGTIMGCHNIKGTSWVGFGFFAAPAADPCGSGQSPGAKMPTSTVWTGSPYGAGKLTVGYGGTLGMMRVDGFTDGYDTIQGVRAYDGTSGAWLTPDANAGDVYDPASQKNYMWNGNNPMSNADPSGYAPCYGCGQTINWGTGADPEFSLFQDYLNVLLNPNEQTPTTKNLYELCGNVACGTARAGTPNYFPCTGPSGESECAGGSPAINGPPTCAQGSYGSWICQDSNYKWRPLPNIMEAGQYPQCFTAGLAEAAGAGVFASGLGGSLNVVLGARVGMATFGLNPGSLTIYAAGVLGAGIAETYTGCGH